MKNERSIIYTKSIRHRAQKDISEVLEQLLSSKDISEAHSILINYDEGVSLSNRCVQQMMIVAN